MDKKNKLELKDNVIVNIPNQLPVIIVRNVIPIPHNDFRIEIGRDFSINALKYAENQNCPYMVILPQKNFFHEEPKISDIEKYGVLAQILLSIKMDNTSESTYKVKFRILKRIFVNKIIKKDNFYQSEYEHVPTIFGNIKKEKALIKLIIQQITSNMSQFLLITENTLLEQIQKGITTDKIADLIVFSLRIEEKEKYKYLKEKKLNKRLMYLLKDIQSKLNIIDLENKINEEVKRSIDENQKEFYLREKIKAIQNELGDKVKKEEEIEKLRKKINSSRMPSNIKEKALQELSRYQSISSAVADSFVIRNYLDFIISLPWNKISKDIEDLEKIKLTLEKNHYGLQKAKERILEYAAVKIMTKKNAQTILCLVGPPGVGKTTLAISIAEALGRKFVKQSLGGLQEESEFKGHRRTYVGAMPGRILDGLKNAGVMNPVFLLDEIDKLVNNFQHNPESSLLEILDPKQNKTFIDLYLSEPFDLSQVLFITTANDLTNVSEPLKDRLEIIELNSYTEKDKLIIAKKYLLPKQLEEHGLQEAQFQIEDKTIIHIIRHYTKEAGIRNLSQKLATLIRKTVKEILINKIKQMQINISNIEKFLGKIIYQHLLAEKTPQIGVVNGLAYTSLGGEILPIETTFYPGKGKLVLTGHLGKVIEESAITAFSFLKSNALKLGIQHDIFEKNDFHVNFLESAVPKDGPSAGITIATSIFSAITKKYVKENIGMTGEITLRGLILPIGGLKEKAIAADRIGLNTIFIPEENLKDIYDIPEEVREKLKIITIQNVNDVFLKALII
ncbi:endopeptidase La [Candidatus Phytoplasma melaleucae]|uniref:Lon protease n=1 Tax=Candidatus Phytoplasma melaleucae TaxID=2982630 RepID=A0ABT9DEK1_9MOLU|nr:endopeptidase La ['Melaleuca sp.' phytoplasma]MDO8168199.1 endopeptidase La ['Melaleuca sp.' phytoplasma]